MNDMQITQGEVLASLKRNRKCDGWNPRSF